MCCVYQLAYNSVSDGIKSDPSKRRLVYVSEVVPFIHIFHVLNNKCFVPKHHSRKVPLPIILSMLLLRFYLLSLQTGTHYCGKTTLTIITKEVNGWIFTLTYHDGVSTVTSDSCDWTVTYDTNLPFRELTLFALSTGGPYTGLCGACLLG